MAIVEVSTLFVPGIQTFFISSKRNVENWVLTWGSTLDLILYSLMFKYNPLSFGWKPGILPSPMLFILQPYKLIYFKACI